jgi:hypothetical protein
MTIPKIHSHHTYVLNLFMFITSRLNVVNKAPCGRISIKILFLSLQIDLTSYMEINLLSYTHTHTHTHTQSFYDNSSGVKALQA